MTDDMNLVNNASKGNIHYMWVPKIHYNLACLMKYQYAVEILKKKPFEYDLENDLYLFCDADSFFIEKPMEVWEHWTNLMIENDLICNNYAQFQSDTRGVSMCYEYGENNPEYMGYYQVFDHSVNICTNIIMGSLKGLFTIVKNIYEMCNHDLNLDFHNRHFPCVNEETYINSMVNNQLNGTLNDKIAPLLFHIETMHVVPYDSWTEYGSDPKVGIMEDQLEANPNAFIVSKYNNTHKTKVVPFSWKTNPIINYVPDYAENAYIILGKTPMDLELLEHRMERIHLRKYETIMQMDFGNNDQYTTAHYLALKDGLARGYNAIMVIDYDVKLPPSAKWPQCCMREIMSKDPMSVLALCGAVDDHCSCKWYMIDYNGMGMMVDLIENKGMTIKEAMDKMYQDGYVTTPNVCCGALDAELLSDPEYCAKIECFEDFEQ